MDFDSLYAELQNSTETIRALLSGIKPEEARFKPDNESWSILEVLCHLHDEEREDFREHLDFVLHRQDEVWHEIDPQAWVTERKYNQQDFGQMQEKFFAQRRQSLEWLRTLAGADWSTIYLAPYGSMTAGELFASWVAHDNLHIRQLVELRRKRIEDITKPYSIQYAGDR